MRTVHKNNLAGRKAISKSFIWNERRRFKHQS